MTDRPSRFSDNARLRAAAMSNAPLANGESGEAVRLVQRALLDVGIALPLSTRHGTSAPDGIFGAETERAVREFQRRKWLIVDGLVGRQTLSALDAALGKPEARPRCGVAFALRPHSLVSAPGYAEHAHSRPEQFAGRDAASVLMPGASGVSVGGGLVLPTSLRFMTWNEITLARSVFGWSLNYAAVLISNALGFGGRPFTTVGPFAGFVTLNMGPVVDDSTLIHELAHAWQSQHHPFSAQFMINSAASQAGATIFGGSA